MGGCLCDYLLDEKEPSVFLRLGGLTRLRPVASAIRNPLGTLSPPFKANCPPPGVEGAALGPTGVSR